MAKNASNRFEAERESLARAARRLGELGYVASHGGNVSFRVSQDVVLVTPTKVPKIQVTASDVCAVDLSGRVLDAAPGRKPTGETPMHLHLLRARPDANSLLHAHPPVLTGFACSDKATLLARPVLPEPAIEVGPAALVEYAEPLTDDLACAFDPFLARHDFFLMRNHGVSLLSREGPERAVELLIMLENEAASILAAVVLGGVKELTRAEVEGLDRVLKTRNLPFPGAPGSVRSLAELFFSER